MIPDPTFAAFCTAGLWPGVGPALIADMTTAGITTPAAVTEEALSALPSVTAKRAARLFTAWVGAGSSYDVAAILSPRGLPVRWSRRLVDLRGDGAAALLTADPWQVLAIAESTVAEADALARAIQPDVTADDPRRGRAIVVRILGLEARDGHTVTPFGLVADELRQYGFVGVAQAHAAVAAAESALLVRIIPGPAETSLALENLATAEEQVAGGLRRLDEAARPLEYRDNAGGELDETQRAAVTTLARHGVSILTGGPGTGKSRTIAAVVALGRRLGLEVALAAPTGRAAKRLTELITSGEDGSGVTSVDDADPEAGTADAAMTIHRLLGARPVDAAGRSGFDYDADHPLSADIVVIDEASMVDAELAAALLRAIPSGAHLLLVGDPAQLPSIGPGRVLGDLLQAGVFPTTELRTLYRQSAGGAIARLAASVREGELVAPSGQDHEVVVVPAPDSARAARRVVQLVTDSIPRVFGVSSEQVQVVTPIHRGPAGTEELNRVLKAQLNPGPHPGSRTVRGFDPGDRVVATANYLDARPFGYANGEIGTVIDTEGKSVLVAFPGGDAEVSGKALGDLKHGWAVTVHRAQGSEWEAVVVVLPPEAGRMLSRPLIYTALTRARRHLSVVHAAGPAVARAVRTIGARPRRTRLADLVSSSAAADPAPASRSAVRR